MWGIQDTWRRSGEQDSRDEGVNARGNDSFGRGAVAVCIGGSSQTDQIIFWAHLKLGLASPQGTTSCTQGLLTGSLLPMGYGESEIRFYVKEPE